MAVMGRLKELIFRRKEVPFDFRGGLGGGWWQVPPGMNLDAYLRAYGQIGWLFACVSRIAASVGETEWHLLSVRGGEKIPIDKHPLLNLLAYVNPFQTGQELFELSQSYLDLVGECFWVLNRNGAGLPAEIWVPPPTRMNIVPSRKEFIAGYTYRYGAEIVPLEIRDVVHFKLPNPNDPYRGLGPTQSIGVDLTSEQYSALYNRNFFFNSAQPGGIVEVDHHLDEDEFARLQERWAERHQGAANAHRVGVLEGGAKFRSISMTQRDMDFWRLRKINRDVILGAFGMPLSVLGISESVNRANAESGEYVFGRWVIKPRLQRFRHKLNEQLVPQFGADLELIFDDPVPKNRELLISEAEHGVRAGYLTVNEARQLLGFESVRTGDVFIMPMTSLPTPAKSGGNGLYLSSILLPVGKGPFETEEQKETYWRVYVKKAEAWEKKLVSALKRMFEGQEIEALGELDEALQPTDILLNQEQAREAYVELARPLLAGLLAEAIGDGEGLVAPEPGHRGRKQEGPEYPFSPQALEWLGTRIGWAAQEIGEETAKLLSKALQAGFEAGEGIPDIARRIQAVFAFSSDIRAERIARTEIIMASNEGALEGYEMSGVVEKVEFFAALDERLCPICLDMHGDIETLQDAHGIIPVHPNCRCTWLGVV